MTCSAVIGGHRSASGAVAGIPSVEGTVEGRTYHGSNSVYTVAVDDAKLRVSVPGSAAAKRWEPGTQVTLGIDPRWVLQYPGA